MKLIQKIAILSIFLIVGCGNKDEQAKKSDVIEINYLKKYPSKEVKLQEIADVKYLALKTSSGKPFHGRIAHCDNKLIIGFVKSIKDVVIFSGEGVEKFRFNHLGKGPEEYTKGSSLSYDAQSKELFIYSVSTRRVNVYSLKGKFKRRFHTYNKMLYTSLIPFNNDLIAYDRHLNKEKIAYLKTSAKDGGLLEIIDTHFKMKREIDIVWNTSKGGTRSYSWYDGSSKVFCGKNLLINDFSSDTIYYYTPAGEVLPHTVLTPSFEKTSEPWNILVNGESQKYAYYTVFKNEMPPKGTRGVIKSLCYDKTNGDVYDAHMYDHNYPDYEHLFRHPRGNGFFIEQLEAYDLLEQNKKGKLYGELKDIASKLKIDDNAVLMIIQLKNKI